MYYKKLLIGLAILGGLIVAGRAQAAYVEWFGGSIPAAWQPGDTLVLSKGSKPGSTRVFYKCNKEVSTAADDVSWIYKVAILSEGISGATITGCTIKRYETGIRIHGGFDVNIENNNISNMWVNGIWITGGQEVRILYNEVRPENPSSKDSTAAAIKIGMADESKKPIERYVTHEVTVRGNALWKARDGLDIDGGDGHEIYENWSGHNSRNGIELDHSRGGRIESNIVDGNGRHGFSLEHVTNYSIRANQSNYNDWDWGQGDDKFGKGFRFKDVNDIQLFHNELICRNSSAQNCPGECVPDNGKCVVVLKNGTKDDCPIEIRLTDARQVEWEGPFNSAWTQNNTASEQCPY